MGLPWMGYSKGPGGALGVCFEEPGPGGASKEGPEGALGVWFVEQGPGGATAGC